MTTAAELPPPRPPSAAEDFRDQALRNLDVALGAASSVNTALQGATLAVGVAQVHAHLAIAAALSDVAEAVRSG